MTSLDLLGQELWLCSDSKEASDLWRKNPQERWRVVSVSEFNSHSLDDPDKIADWIAAKKAKPGPVMGSGKQGETFICEVTGACCTNLLPGSICQHCQQGE